jgi:hypothetical protein
MTHYEKTPLRLRKGDSVTHFDDGSDGYPVKWVNGIVTGVSDEGVDVQWEDLPWPTDYSWDSICLKGEQIIDKKRHEGLC